jgi:hypothetical protein
VTGGKNGPNLVVNSEVDIGTKAIVVTGNLTLFGAAPNVFATRLAKTARIGDKIIEVIGNDLSGWKVDIIVNLNMIILTLNIS